MNCNGLMNGYNLIDKVNCFIQSNNGNWEFNRKVIRDELVDLFKNEVAGKGTGNLATKTIYCVENINQEVIYLKRPAILNNGFDFEIHTKLAQFNGRIKSRPRHEDIIDLLSFIKQTDINLFTNIQLVIDEIYNCNETNINSFNLSINNIAITTILKLIKWLFIEQDVTYWHFSGRNMLYTRLKNV